MMAILRMKGRKWNRRQKINARSVMMMIIIIIIPITTTIITISHWELPSEAEMPVVSTTLQVVPVA